MPFKQPRRELSTEQRDLAQARLVGFIGLAAVGVILASVIFMIVVAAVRLSR